MSLMKSQAWPILVVALAEWLNRQKQDVVAYLQEENRVLRVRWKSSCTTITGNEITSAWTIR